MLNFAVGDKAPPVKARSRGRGSKFRGRGRRLDLCPVGSPVGSPASASASFSDSNPTQADHDPEQFANLESDESAIIMEEVPPADSIAVRDESAIAISPEKFTTIGSTTLVPSKDCEGLICTHSSNSSIRVFIRHNLYSLVLCNSEYSPDRLTISNQLGACKHSSIQTHNIVFAVGVFFH